MSSSKAVSRPRHWLTAISLIACLILAFLYCRELRKNALLRVDNDASVKQSRQEIAELKQKLSTTAAGTEKGRRRVSLSEKSVAVPGIAIHMSDVARAFPEYAALQQKQMRRRMMYEWGAAPGGPQSATGPAVAAEKSPGRTAG